MQVRTSSSVVTGNDLLKKVAETMKFMRNFASHSRTFLLKIGSSHESITLHIHLHLGSCFKTSLSSLTPYTVLQPYHSMMIGKRIFFVLQKKKNVIHKEKKKNKKFLSFA